jgi:hypothetical protein
LILVMLRRLALNSLIAFKRAKLNQKRYFAMRRPSLFKERDLTRATKAVLSAGLNVERVEVGKDGKIVVFPAKPSSAEQVRHLANDCPAPNKPRR